MGPHSCKMCGVLPCPVTLSGAHRVTVLAKKSQEMPLLHTRGISPCALQSLMAAPEPPHLLCSLLTSHSSQLGGWQCRQPSPGSQALHSH